MNRNKKIVAAMIVCAAVLVAAVAMSLGNGIGYRYENADKYTVGGGTVEGAVRNLDVDWIDGRVTVAYHQEPTVLVSETAKRDLSDDMRLRWWLDGDTLRVRYAKAGAMRLNWNLQKELTLTLPEGADLGEASLAATSGELAIPAMKADSLKLRVTSGKIRASAEAGAVESRMTSGDMDLNLRGQAREITAHATSGNIGIRADAADKLDASVTSGLVRIKADRAGELKAAATSGNLDIEAAESGSVALQGTSAGVTVRLGKLDRLEVGVTSGDVKAFLPAAPGFRARVTTTSGSFNYDMSLTKQGSDYICGDGSAEVSIHATSGDVWVGAAEQQVTP